MRNVLLTLFSALILLNGSIASAQIVTQNGKDTAVGNWNGSEEFQVLNAIKSGSANPVYLKWNVTDYRFPPGWDTVGSGFCDNVICYSALNTTSNLFKDRTVWKSAEYNNNGFSGVEHDFHMVFKANNPSIGTSAWVRINARDTVGGTTRILTFIANNGATGITSSSSSDDVVLYPNPARDAVNVIYDSKAGVKTIAVYNLIGKLMGPIYKPADNSSAKINLDDMPNGIYFLRLMDDHGHVLATRRFTRQ